MKYPILILVLIGSPLTINAQVDSLQRKILTVEDLRADLRFYRKVLEETHPGLYRYTTAECMHNRFDSLEHQLNAPLPFYAFYKILAALNSDIRCAHTHITPTSDFRKHLNGINTIPFFVYPIQGRLYVVFNGSADETIGLGYELLSINRHPVDSVARVLKRHFWADGFADLPKNAVLQGSAFCYFYYALIEQTDQFDLQFRDPNGKEHSIVAAAQPFSISEKRFMQKPVNQTAVKLYNRSFKSPWRLSFPADIPSIAFLRFDSFGGKGIHSTDEARKAMQKFMDRSLKEINRNECSNLIIDVRDNGGGWDVQGVELLSYLIKTDTAFRYYRRAFTITDDSEFLNYADLSQQDKENVKAELKREPDGTFSLREEKSTELQWQKPKRNRFRGSVYILMNERTASTAAEFVALCKSNGIGVLVGSEAGGAYEGGNSGSFIHLSLPNSKMYVTTPLVRYENAVAAVDPGGRGTLPNHFVSMQPNDLLTRFDRPLAFVKDLILKQAEIK